MPIMRALCTLRAFETRGPQCAVPERDLAEAWKRAEEEIEKGAAAGIFGIPHQRDAEKAWRDLLLDRFRPR
jgi:hypothetical protein